MLNVAVNRRKKMERRLLILRGFYCLSTNFMMIAKMFLFIICKDMYRYIDKLQKYLRYDIMYV